MDDGLSLAEWVVGKSDAGSDVNSRCAVRALSQRTEALRRVNKLLLVAVGYIPRGVVVIAKAQIDGKVVVHPPVILPIKIPVGIIVADRSRGSRHLQYKREVRFQAGKTVVVVRLDPLQPCIQPVETDLYAAPQRMGFQRFGHVVK